MRIYALIGAGMLAVMAATAAQAAVLTLDNSPSTFIQQTNDHPCVIGDPSCNNPAGFGFTTLAPGTNTYTNIGSPIYTVGQIRDLVGNTFRVGIDVNTTTHPLATEILDGFSLWIAGANQFSYAGPTQLNDNNNGSGFSDSFLNGFDLTSFSAAAAAQFFVTYHGATDGRDEFFLNSTQDQGTPVPEPASLGLLGLGFAGLAALRRKRTAA